MAVCSCSVVIALLIHVYQVATVQKVDNVTSQINHNPMHVIGFPYTYPLENDLPSGYHYCIGQSKASTSPLGILQAFATFAVLGD